MAPIVVTLLQTALPVVISGVAAAISGKKINARINQVQSIAVAPPPRQRASKKAIGLYGALAALAGTVAPVLLAQVSPETHAAVVQICTAIISAAPPAEVIPVETE